MENRPSRVPLVIFDIDGTLIDSQHSILLAARTVCARHGVPQPAADVILGATGLSLTEAVGHLNNGLTQDVTAKIIQDYMEIFTELREHPAECEGLYPGVLQGLDELKRRGWRLAVATANSRNNTARNLETYGIGGYFASLQTADGNPSKPDPTMVLKAIAETGADARNTVMVGDSSFDMMMACNAGVAAVGVSWGFQKKEDLIAAGARHVVDSFPELLAYLIASETGADPSGR